VVVSSAPYSHRKIEGAANILLQEYEGLGQIKGGNPGFHQIIANAGGPSLGQALVVFFGADVVGVAVDEQAIAFGGDFRRSEGPPL
jgi:hypothetical protein